MHLFSAILLILPCLLYFASSHSHVSHQNANPNLAHYDQAKCLAQDTLTTFLAFSHHQPLDFHFHTLIHCTYPVSHPTLLCSPDMTLSKAILPVYLDALT